MRPPRLMLLMSLWSLALANPADSLTLHVPSGYATIQAALTAAASGDTVLVAPGTYVGSGNKDLDFAGKSIVLRSSGGAAATVIDCEGSGRGIHFHTNETAAARVEGLTIRGGGVGGSGGAIHCMTASPTITDCVFTANTATNGGAVSVHFFGAPALECCRITGNTAQEGGALHFMYAGSVVVSECILTGNKADTFGGAVSSRYASSPQLVACTLAGNTASTGGGAYVYQAALSAERTILHGNCASEGAQLFTISGTAVSFVCSAVDSTGVDGTGPVSYTGSQVFDDPLLCAPAPCASAPTDGGDYAPSAGSPILAENSPCGETIGAIGVPCGVVGVAASRATVPEVLARPNPARRGATIAFSLVAPARARLEVHDVAGRRVAVLLDEMQAAGAHEIVWTGRDDRGRRVAPGIYFTAMETAAGRSTAKLVLLD